MFRLTIDLYTDIGCPWCLIGQARLDRVLTQQFAEVSVEIVHHPVVLNPDCPAEGINLAEMLKARRGVKDLNAIWRRVETEAERAGIKLDMSKQKYAYPSLAAHTLIRLAQSRGTQHALAMALREVHFHEARKINDVEVLADIASRFGFDYAEAKKLAQDSAELEVTRRAAARAATSGVQGVPHFVFNGVVALSGGQSESAIAGAISDAIAA